MTVVETEKLREATFTKSGAWNADRSTPLERVASHYVLRLIRLMDSEGFPEIRKAFGAEIADEGFVKEMTGHLECVADFSPALVIQIAVLVPDVVKLLLWTAAKPGLNSSVAAKGLLILSCIQQSKDCSNYEEILEFWRDHGRKLLDMLDEPQVFEYAVSTLKDPRMSDRILENLAFPMSVTEMFSYLRLYEAALLGNFHKPTAVLLRTVMTSNDAVLLTKTCDVVCSKIRSQGPLPAEEFEEILNVASTSKNFAPIRKVLERMTGKEQMLHPVPISQKDLAKEWALHFLCQSDSFGLSSKETSMLISSLELELLERLSADLSFVLKLLKSRLHPKDVPKFVLALKPTLFRKISNVSNVTEMMEVADILKRTFDLTSNWKTALQFSGEEIKLLTGFVFSLLGGVLSMDPAETFVAVSLCAAIFQTNEEVVAECEKPEHILRLYMAVQGLMDLLSRWTSCLRIPAFCKVLRSMETLSNHVDFVTCISNLAAMFDWLENCQRQTEMPTNLLKPLKVVLCTFGRLPFFYSFLLVPPSVWEKDWNPVTSLEPNSLRFDVPVVPAHFLQDELTLKQFVFRIRTLGWISRQNFEEIWMSVLGVLSLRNEPEMREEEQHCITLVTCQAVRTLTALLEQNILIPRPGNPVCKKYLHISRDPHLKFFTTEKGEKLRRVFDTSRLLGNSDRVNLERLHSNQAHEYGLGQLSREYIDCNLRSSTNSFQQLTNIDLESCIHFMVDLYMQWLHDAETPYVLVLDVFRSLLVISDFFTDSIHFLWLLEQSLVFHKRILPEDPLCLEPALVGCVLKSAAFVQMDPETWDDVRKVAEGALVSSNVATRRTALHGVLCILQKYAKNPDNMDPSSLLNLILDYVTKYLGSDNPGLEWHQSLLWASAFYCTENFASFQYRSDNIVDCVVQFAVNALLDSKSISQNMQCTILQGLERLCLGEKLTGGTRRIINKEIINMVRNVNKPQLFEPSLRILLTLMYTELPMMKENNLTSDPETMLAAMEWIGVLFHRLKTGSDAECETLSDVLVSVVPDILPAADILNRLLAEFMSTEARVAKFIVPTLFQVFQNARAEGQQSMVLEWILLSLSNFTRICGNSASMGAWNICCLFAAASANHWLRILFPFVSQPVDTENVYESQLFVTAVLDFNSQLGAEQKKSLVTIFQSAKGNSPLYLTAADLLCSRPMI